MLTFIQQISTLVTGHQWLGIAIVLVGWAVSLTSDTSKLPLNIPDRFKPLIALLFGQLYAVLEAIQSGEDWKTAVAHGIVAALSATGFSTIVVNTIFNGTLPKWLSWVSVIDPKLVQAKKLGLLVAPLWGKKTIKQAA